uniref:Ovule protein n=1 Tax=Schistosoma curassoni TaxID=6186 RepID=A0A183JV49_9TREM
LINILNLERGLIQKSKSSIQEIETLCVNYGAENELDSQSVKISSNVLSRRDEPHSQDRSRSRFFINDSHSLGDIKNDPTKNFKAGCIGEHIFGECLSRGKFHLRNSCPSSSQILRAQMLLLP